MTNYLFPNSYKKVGWLLFVPSFLGAMFFSFFQPEMKIFDLPAFAFFTDKFFFNQRAFFVVISNNLFDELLGLFLIVGGVLVAFSKEKIEDEMVAKIRLESLVWATYVNYTILLFCVLFVYGMPFYHVMLYNMVTLLLFFIFRFYWVIYKNSKLLKDEKLN